MTPELLDKIEKEANAGGPEDDGGGDIAAFLVDCRILPLVKALREAWTRCETLRDLADEKAHESGLYARRMGQAQEAAREARAALKEREGDMHARIRAGYDKTVADSWRAHCAKIEKERDEARAEVERMKAAAARFVNQYPWQDGPEIQELKALKEG